jgi:protein-S-isoprenylcysteine O-methyltransferase Ste14
MTALKSLFFLIFVPGLLIGYIPYVVSTTDTEFASLGVIAYIAFLLWFLASAAMFWCFWNFLVNGRGTPAPIDPPKELVVVGLYRYVRNPMYVAGLIGLLGWILWSPSFSLILVFIIFFIATHLFITLYEEPNLKKRFGESYEQYLHQVPRWIPKFTKNS